MRATKSLYLKWASHFALFIQNFIFPCRKMLSGGWVPREAIYPPPPPVAKQMTAPIPSTATIVPQGAATGAALCHVVRFVVLLALAVVAQS